jgi:hypothetical protein
MSASFQRGLRSEQRGPGTGPSVRTVSLWGLSPGDLVWYFFSPSGIWPHSRAAYHEQSCLLAICRVARGKGLALTIQSFGWGQGAALGWRCRLFFFLFETGYSHSGFSGSVCVCVCVCVVREGWHFSGWLLVPRSLLNVLLVLITKQLTGVTLSILEMGAAVAQGWF